MTSSVCRRTNSTERLFHWMRASLIAMIFVIGGGALGGSTAYANLDKDSELDGRLDGYSEKVALEKDSTTGLWFVFFFLVVVGCSALFKTAKRE